MATLPDKVTIVEVGLRDGLQNEEVTLPTEQKARLLNALLAVNLTRLEVTAFVSPKWIPQLADAEALVAMAPRLPEVTYSALIPNERGYERAVRVGIPEVNVVISASESHCRRNLNKSIAEQLVEISRIAARAQADGVRLRASISVAFGCPFEGQVPLEQVVQIAQRLAEMDAAEIVVNDTLGIGNPRQVQEVFGALRVALSGVALAAHFHDTWGRGLANVLAALESGTTTFDTAIGGGGGCPYTPGSAGNTATEDVVDMLHGMGIETGINLASLLEASELLRSTVGHELYSHLVRATHNACYM
jgi:hydroxymethylglutaryl-CoA lyase